MLSGSYTFGRFVNGRHFHVGEHLCVHGHFGKLQGRRFGDIFTLVTYLCDSQTLPYLSKLLLAVLKLE